ncbi:alpha-(1-_3)-arabinofuranosyltransferase family protein [Gordonia sp. (in: high G+C Gram-positive bacteria)]|uniref:alpha-(1->3)-arabinofuranosyltransferase domain-containing protein n=1 Tax=Gordonia sp. (in: high G+C Gram-positive bacteria) TaxID=84139 RepID=UPI003529712B
MADGSPRDRLLTRRDLALAALVALVVSFAQAPGRIAPDTKLDLTADPFGFLSRALHLWSPDAPMGQIQNQAYGYFFPHGLFFALGDLAGLPGWVTQRLWWALLLTVGFAGLVRLAEALRVGSYPSRLLAAAIFATSPRVLTTLGSISSETLPFMLAPWVLVPMVRALDAADTRPLWQNALRSACAVALMGAVNAVATAAAAGVAAAWWLFGLLRRDSDLGRRLRFGAWWALGLALACLWWLVPLLLMSRLSPPFLDFIESSRVTTEWTSLTEVLRGTSSWTPFVSDERAAGAVLVSQPAAVLATGLLAAAGLAGLAMSRMPFRRRLVAILVAGLVLMCLGYPGALGSPLAAAYRDFLDGAGAPLRNLHKFDPLLRIPLTLGIAHLLARVRIPVGAASWRAVNGSAAAQRGLAAALVVVVAAIGTGTLAWTGGIAGAGSYRAIPSYWRETADWLADQSHGDPAPPRALLVPGAPFADQLWGSTHDEPLQPLARTPWAVRDAIPLTPPGAIRALDSVQRALANGRGSAGLAPTLAEQGVGYLVLRADLDPSSSRSARPLLVAQALAESPGITPVKTFGPPTAPPAADGFVVDNGLRPALPAVTIYRVDRATGTGPRLTPLNDVPRVTGGAEALLAVNDARARRGLPPLGPSLLTADARAAGLGDGPGPIITDTPVLRETDFGRVDDHSSAIRSPGDARLTKNAAADYPVAGQAPVVAQWLLDGQPGRVRVTSSGSAADATQPGQTAPATSTAAAFDADPRTAWVSRGLDSAVGRWLQIDFTEPVSNLAVTVTTAKAIGPDVTSLLVTTDAGSAVAQGVKPGEPVRILAPSGPTRHVQIRAIETGDGTAGNQFALAGVALSDAYTDAPIAIRQQVLLPETTGNVQGWVLGPELTGRSACVTEFHDGAAGRVRCAAALGLDSETPGLFTRSLWVPRPVAVTPTVVLRPVPGAELGGLLDEPGALRAEGPSSVTDVRGSAAAAVDGDPDTTWIAPEPTDRKSKKPTLTVHLPAPAEVSGLRLRTADGYPARPTEVSVDLGTGPQKAKVDDQGTVRLTPARTDTVAITVVKTADLLDTNDLGFTTPAPAGISEVQVIGAPPARAFAPARPVVIGCDTDPSGPLGLGLTAAGRLIRLQVHTTAGDLAAGRPVVAEPCPGPPIDLGAGRQEIAVNPGRAFSVESVDLAAGTPAAIAPATAPPVGEWRATHRTLTVTSGTAARLLSVPESTNPGWTARLGGQTLTPVVVDGWQQGWVIPAGAAGTVVLTYDADTPYRWSLLFGLILLVVLFVAAFWPRRRISRGSAPTRPRPAPRPAGTRPRRFFDHVSFDRAAPRACAALAGLAAAWLLTGWWGLGIAALGGLATTRLGHSTPLRNHRAARVTTVFAAMSVATVALAAGPWNSGTPYTGYDALPQAAALLALTVLVAGTVVPPRE